MSDAGSQAQQSASSEAVKLDGLFAFKVGMATVFEENGQAVPVTVLKYEPWIVTQLKTDDKEGYTAIQISSGAKKPARSSKGESGHAKKAGFEHAARHTGEIRQDFPEGLAVGQKVDIESLVKGDLVKLTARSKGRGFAGVVKRWGFAGGPASHGSKFHRRPGSVGNRTWPARVMAGKRFPGHYGDKNITIRNVQVIDVIPSEGVVLLKGSVPGARNSLVKVLKEKR